LLGIGILSGFLLVIALGFVAILIQRRISLKPPKSRSVSISGYEVPLGSLIYLSPSTPILYSFPNSASPFWFFDFVLSSLIDIYFKKRFRDEASDKETQEPGSGFTTLLETVGSGFQYSQTWNSFLYCLLLIRAPFFFLSFFLFFFKFFLFISHSGHLTLPGFLKLEFDTDIREEKTIALGGGGNVSYGILVNKELRAKYPNNADSIAIKRVVASPHTSLEDSLQAFHQEVSILKSLFLSLFLFPIEFLVLLFFFVFRFFEQRKPFPLFLWTIISSNQHPLVFFRFTLISFGWLDLQNLPTPLSLLYTRSLSLFILIFFEKKRKAKRKEKKRIEKRKTPKTKWNREIYTQWSIWRTPTNTPLSVSWTSSFTFPLPFKVIIFFFFATFLLFWKL